MALTVLLVPKGTDLMSSAVAWCEHDDIAHIAIDFGDGYTVAEEFCGCWIRPSSYYSNPAIIRYPLAMAADQEAKARQWLYDQVGKGYAWGQIAADFLELHHLPVIDDQDGRYVCSSLAAKAYEVAGLELFDKPAVEVTPKDWDQLWTDVHGRKEEA